MRATETGYACGRRHRVWPVTFPRPAFIEYSATGAEHITADDTFDADYGLVLENAVKGWCALHDSNMLVPSGARDGLNWIRRGVPIPTKLGWCALHDSNVRPPGS